ncbi:hypothetical protein NE237_033152 [Protea cynaroides]|uniref:Uncharacterized protein n=1 Tax=Protea cynaroides TaxID=273540 RepID=A0A9Q0R3S3_9MAGN|nr:hypothetical protein NE237_033152 [Protea cynaroides]
MVNTCNFIELPSHGPQYTWSNRRREAANIRIKLDWVFVNPRSSWAKHPFLYEVMWSRHFHSRRVVKRVWSIPDSAGSASLNLQQKLTATQSDFKSHSGPHIDTQREQVLQQQLAELLSLEALFWRQKSRIDWLKLGDANTSFFHTTTI